MKHQEKMDSSGRPVGCALCDNFFPLVDTRDFQKRTLLSVL